jgi:hypothetical protein
MVVEGRRVTVAETEQKENVIQGSAYSVVYDKLGCNKVYAQASNGRA